jgi:hypothetical protein
MPHNSKAELAWRRNSDVGRVYLHAEAVLVVSACSSCRTQLSHHRTAARRDAQGARIPPGSLRMDGGAATVSAMLASAATGGRLDGRCEARAGVEQREGVQQRVTGGHTHVRPPQEGGSSSYMHVLVKWAPRAWPR